MIPKLLGFSCLPKFIFALMVVVFCFVETKHMNRAERFTEEANCINANETIRYVASCPENKTSDSFIERSWKKNCSQYQACNDKPLYYHCVRYKEGLVEVCSERTTISGKCCNIFEEGLGRVAEDFTKNCSTCDFHYCSDESVPECVKPAMLTPSNHITKRVTNDTTETQRTYETTEIANSSGTSTAKQQDHNLTLTAVLIAVAVVVVLVSIAVCILCIKGNKKHYYNVINDRKLIRI